MLSAIEVVGMIRQYGRVGFFKRRNRPVSIEFLSYKLYQANSSELRDLLSDLEQKGVVSITGDDVSLVGD